MSIMVRLVVGAFVFAWAYLRGVEEDSLNVVAVGLVLYLLTLYSKSGWPSSFVLAAMILYTFESYQAAMYATFFALIAWGTVIATQENIGTTEVVVLFVAFMVDFYFIILLREEMSGEVDDLGNA